MSARRNKRCKNFFLPSFTQSRLLDVLKLGYMDAALTPEEKRLIGHAQQAIIKYNTIRHAHGGIDTLYAFILSESGSIHDGACVIFPCLLSFCDEFSVNPVSYM